MSSKLRLRLRFENPALGKSRDLHLESIVMRSMSIPR
jgi:hypothetical protein